MSSVAETSVWFIKLFLPFFAFDLRCLGFARHDTATFARGLLRITRRSDTFQKSVTSIDINVIKYKAMWWVYALLSAFFASLTAIFAKIGIANVNSNLATSIRTIVILIIVWSIVLVRGEEKGLHSLTKHNLLFLVISGMATGCSWIFYFKALQVGEVSQVAPIDKLSIALTIVLSAVFLGETLTIKTIIGAALIIAGTLVLIWK